MTINQFEDDEFEGENWDDDQDEGQFEDDDIEEQEKVSKPAPKKSSMGLVILVLIFGALGGGGYYYIKVMGGSVPFLNNVPGLSQLAQNNGEAQENVDVSQVETEQNVAGGLPMPQATSDEFQQETPLEAPLESMEAEGFGDDTLPQSMDVVSDETDMTNDFLLPEAMQSEEAEAVASEAFEAPDLSLSSDEDMFEGTDALEKDMTPDMPGAGFEVVAPVSEKTEGNNVELQKTVAQNADLEAKLVVLEAKISERDHMISARDNEIQALNEKIKEISKHKKAMTSKVETVAVNKDVLKKDVVWVLKSAKPGKAWISEKGTAGTRIVSVGDKVDGIGQVTSIGLDDGKWVVKAKAGRISQ